MSLPSFSVRNIVLVNMLMVAVLIGGGLFSLSLTREMFPESRPNRLLISAVHPGRQAVEIQKAVTIKIEESLRSVEGIEKVESTVGESLSTTTVILDNDVDDVEVVLQEVKNQIDSLQDLPDDLEQVSITKLEPRLPVIVASLYGDGDEAALKKAADRMRDDLLRLPGVSDVELSGIRDDEISVEVQPDELLRFNVTFDEVADAIRASNLDISSGLLKGERKTVPVRVIGEATRGVDLGEIVVRSDPSGRNILLKDVAKVRDDFVESDLETYFNGRPSVSCTVYAPVGQDAIQIASLVKAYVAGKTGQEFDPHGMTAALRSPWYQKPFRVIGAGISVVTAKLSGRPDPREAYETSLTEPFPHDFEVKLHTDLSRFVSGRLNLMLRNGLQGLVLVLICLYLFLDRRVAFWTAFGLPVSFLGTFMAMWALGVTVNLLSMFGLIIVLGIIVDDAIVIGENIYRRIEEGMPPVRAAIEGAEEVMWPVTVAVLTTIAAFSPLLFVKGQIGDFMEELPLVVIAALSVSLAEALIILPAHLAHLPSREETEAAAKSQTGGVFGRVSRKISGAQEWFIKDFLTGWYQRLLRFLLGWRYVTVAASIFLLMVVGGMFAGGIVESVFVQKMDSETLVCSLKMPVGTTADNTREQLLRLTAAANEMPEVESVQMTVARQYDVTGAGAMGNTSASHLGQIVIELKESDERDRLGMRSSQEILLELRRFGREGLSGVNSVSWETLNGGPGGKAIQLEVTGPDFADAVAVSDDLKRELEGYAGVFDLDDNHEEGQTEVTLQVLRAAEPTGVNETVFGGHVRAALYGREARRITRNREDVKIMVRYPESYRENPSTLESMRVPIGAGLDRRWVPLRELAEIREEDAESTLYRSDRRRSVTVTGEIDDDIGDANDILGRITQYFETEIAPEFPGVTLELEGQQEEQKKAFGSLRIAFPVALLLIYTLLAGLFKSYLQPVVVMSAIPFGLFGAVLGHWLTGNPMTFLSWIGLVALTGILVNDSLVLVDFINTRIRDGLDEFEATVQGATLRLRAILLTTVTTVAGLTPLMFETSFQAKFLIPMAVTLTFGLLFATALTLIIVPCINLIFFDLRGLPGRVLGMGRNREVPSNPSAPSPEPHGLDEKVTG